MATSWIPSSVHGPFPPNMVPGGVDSDGAQIYVGRAHHAGDLIPAKVIPDKSAAYVAYGGEETLVHQVEVLVHKQLMWDTASAGQVPLGAVIGGHTSDGETLYIGRTYHEGSQTIGKVQCSHNCIYIPYGGAEVSVPTYEVLCERDFGIQPPAYSTRGYQPICYGTDPTVRCIIMSGGGYSHYGFHPDYLSNPSGLSYGATEPSAPSAFAGRRKSSSSSDSSRSPSISGTVKPQVYGTAVPNEFAGCWQHCNVSGPFPPNMVRAGVDCDGEVIYVGRAFHEGDMVPAKVIPTKNVAFVCHGGEEVLKEDFEVLRYGAFVWEYASNGSVPETAMRIGQTTEGEPLYMGRAIYSGSQTPGKVHPSHGCCYLPFDGAEVSVTDYEVLCIR
ncbi:uncharacterized protein LOC128302926 [Anopheles moucheti]|uniref:uncharacterized protein LOC128302926 n=1 Tax=Anopheles moucheti TaxID=186751 RepID=UPI0022EFF600|nr:uncharacterized protein LOC128302926 [Anopheles moucheti]